MAKRQRRGLTKKSKTRSKLPTDPELIEKGIMWWRRTFPKCQLRPSWPVSAVMRGRRLNEWGERDQRGRLTKDEGRYVLLRSHDGGQALPLHELTVCGLFRWHGPPAGAGVRPRRARGLFRGSGRPQGRPGA